MINKFCSNCGEKLTENNKFCSECGKGSNATDSSSGKIKAKNHESYNGFTLLAFLVPPAGFMIGILYLAKDSKIDKKLGEHTLSFSVFSIILWWIVLSVASI